MVTMKKIAEICGVSRGTVDRVLNNRGRVSDETAKHIRRIARQLGYERNPAGRALAARKNHPVVGVILSSEGNPFWDDVIQGIEGSASNYDIYGSRLKLCTMKGYNVEEQLHLLRDLRSEVQALIINPIDDPAIAAELNGCMKDGILVITLNNDICGCGAHTYVGSDYTNGGATACALIAAFLGKTAEIGVVMGSWHILGHRQRLEGFKKRMEKEAGFHIAEVIVNEDDEITSYARTRDMLQKHPEINAVFLVAAGVYGACRAVMELPEEKRPLVLAFDSVPSTVAMMKNGVIRAILYQHPYHQGKRAADLAFEFVVHGKKPGKEQYILSNEIRILENLRGREEGIDT